MIGWSEYRTSPAVLLWVVWGVDGHFFPVDPESTLAVDPRIGTLGDGDDAQLLPLHEYSGISGSIEVLLEEVMRRVTELLFRIIGYRPYFRLRLF